MLAELIQALQQIVAYTGPQGAIDIDVSTVPSQTEAEPTQVTMTHAPTGIRTQYPAIHPLSGAPIISLLKLHQGPVNINGRPAFSANRAASRPQAGLKAIVKIPEPGPPAQIIHKSLYRQGHTMLQIAGLSYQCMSPKNLPPENDGIPLGNAVRNDLALALTMPSARIRKPHWSARVECFIEVGLDIDASIPVEQLGTVTHNRRTVGLIPNATTQAMMRRTLNDGADRIIRILTHRYDIDPETIVRHPGITLSEQLPQQVRAHCSENEGISFTPSPQATVVLPSPGQKDSSVLHSLSQALLSNPDPNLLLQDYRSSYQNPVSKTGITVTGATIATGKDHALFYTQEQLRGKNPPARREIPPADLILIHFRLEYDDGTVTDDAVAADLLVIGDAPNPTLFITGKAAGELTPEYVAEFTRRACSAGTPRTAPKSGFHQDCLLQARRAMLGNAQAIRATLQELCDTLKLPALPPVGQPIKVYGSRWEITFTRRN